MEQTEGVGHIPIVSAKKCEENMLNVIRISPISQDPRMSADEIY